MKSFCILVMVVWHSSLFWSFGSTVEDVAIFLQGGIPQIFEGIPTSLICITKSSNSDRTWIKDGIKIARCLHNMPEENRLPQGVSVHPGSNERGMTLFCILDFENLTISDHNGNYTCLGKTVTGSTKAETYNFAIKERTPFCEPKQPHVEYLVNEIAVLSCHNPNYYLNRTIMWLRGNTEDDFLSFQSTEYDYTNRLNAVIKMESQFNESVFSCHAFTQGQLETFTDKDSYSCSVGPVFVYNTPFLSIMEVQNREKTVVNCRLVPSNVKGEVRWRLPQSSLSYTISTLVVSSNITFSGIGAFQEEVVNVTCVGFYQGFNISSVYTLDLSTSPNRGSGVPSGDTRPDFLSPLNIVLIALGSLILIAIIVCVCLIICKFKRSRENQIPAYSNDASFMKNQKQIGKVKDAVELDSNLQRYYPEPFRSSQSQSQLTDQRQYDVPPFADRSGDTHGLNMSQAGYEIDDRIYDPATTEPTNEPAEYYQMGDDMEEYADISEVMEEHL